jgi:hypothetical protein
MVKEKLEKLHIFFAHLDGDGDGECDARKMMMVFISFFDRQGESKTHQNKYTKKGWCTKKKHLKKDGQKTHLNNKVVSSGGVHIR